MGALLKKFHLALVDDEISTKKRKNKEYEILLRK